MKDFFENHKKLVIIALVGFVVLFIVSGVKNQREQAAAEKRRQEWVQQQEEAMQDTGDDVSDSLLMSMQDSLISTYGKLPDGYIWDMDGSLLSLGDKSMSAEDVVYAYLNGIRSLDMSIVQKYSRNSVVVDTYEGYFDSNDKSADYYDQFIRNMYREAMLSMEIGGIENASVFAENKQVFTVKVKMLDLTTKDFWFKDKPAIYKNLQIYNRSESDTTKGEMYLYNYVLGYYKSAEAATRDVTFDITVQRYPDLDTGWLVSIDTDVNSACRYTDGTLVVQYIQQMYLDEGLVYLESIEEADKEADAMSESTVSSSSDDSDGEE